MRAPLGSQAREAPQTTALLLRSWSDQLWAVPATDRYGPSLHCCGAVNDPAQTGRPIKTNRRDAIQLARLLRAGEVTDVRVTDEGHEAIRELIRSRETAVDDLRRKRQAISSLML